MSKIERHPERARREASPLGKRVEGSKPIMAAFLALCCVVCLVPLVGMAWAPTNETTENRELASVPQLLEDGQLNTDYLSDWGTYFEDHFAYRNQLVSANAELRAKAFGTSATDTVVVGTDGWLYYAGTLSEYCGWQPASARAVSNIVHNLSLMQAYCEEQGANFVLAVAPNKNSLYSEHMPYYYVKANSRTLDSLAPLLVEEGVNYVDLFAAFEEQDECLYYQRDTHWNTKGALLAYSAIQTSLGRSDDGAVALEPTAVDDYVGDLNRMLYPTTSEPENDYSYADQLSWSYVEGDATDDAWVETSGAGEGSVLMFRDSFTNNMLQFFANGYETAYFSKYVPYDLTQVGELGVDSVVIERAERHIADLGDNPAIMPAPEVSISVTTNVDCTSDGLEVGQDGSFTVVSGTLPEGAQSEGAAIYIGVEGEDGVTWYTPFHVSSDESDYGYKAYLPESALNGVQKIWVASGADDAIKAVQSIDL